ncbi:unnamed protein product [Soboliphyme baturini]|uniref:G_PROTEIN_RECEP_F1_2 domain-containing protein n=1 Tax=Soboliphyme baturini TaxID=241478 RepID=A0A183J130_9BILA|nr:unnamed protein product [Soboliphyme baturini]
MLHECFRVLSNNRIKKVDGFAFQHSRIGALKLNNNPIEKISENAFARMEYLGRLDLSGTKITELPEHGLKEVEVLTIKDTPSLKILPSIFALMHLKKAELTYPYHCCLFKVCGLHQENLHEIRRLYCKSHPDTKKVEARTEHRGKRFFLSSEIWFSDALPDPGVLKPDVVCDEQDDAQVIRYYTSIECSPMPDALNPCEDITGSTVLRTLIWLVWTVAIFANLSALATLVICNPCKATATRLLLVNLALADFLMGLYLAIISVQDVRTAQHYYNFAVDWQTGFGCKFCGFLATFSSELSVVVLTLLSFEVNCFSYRSFPFKGRHS